MTVTYSTNVSFLSLLLRWRGSIWKLLWKKFLVFLLLHYSIYVLYNFLLPEYHRARFRTVAVLFDDLTKRIPIQFILGFYVTSVFSRWWSQATSLGWPDKFMTLVVGNIRGTSEEVVIIRRTFARLCNLFFVCCWKGLSLKIKRRFPTDKHLLKSGLMTQKEWDQYESVSDIYGRSFLPYYWMINLLGDIKERNFLSDEAMRQMMNDLADFKGAMGTCSLYNWIDIPLVYTQVVTIATYGYFAFCVVGRQALMGDSSSVPVDLYFPFFTTLEFFFYVGWLTVGESLKFAFGEEDDDFNMNYILDRNMFIAFMYADTLYKQSADLVQDYFVDQEIPSLNHTRGSYNRQDSKPGGKIDKIKIKSSDTAVVDKFGKPVPEDVPLIKKRFSLPVVNFPLKNFDNFITSAIQETVNVGKTAFEGTVNAGKTAIEGTVYAGKTAIEGTVYAGKTAIEGTVYAGKAGKQATQYLWKGGGHHKHRGHIYTPTPVEQDSNKLVETFELDTEDENRVQPQQTTSTHLV